VLQGGDRLHRLRGGARGARAPGPAEKLVAVRDRRARDRPPGQRRDRRRRGHQRHASRRAWSVGIGMAYVPAERPPGHAPRDRRSRQDAPGVVEASRSTERARERGRGKLSRTTCSTTPSTTGRASKATSHASGSPGTPRTRSARSCSSSRPRSGRRVTKDEPYTEVESVKAVSDVIAPLSGEIVEVNEALAEPRDDQRGPLRRGWLVKVKLSDPTSASSLLDAAAYEASLRLS
jgi:hypothetical protein